MEKLSNRRPLKSRSTGWAARLTRLVLRTGLSANAVSITGIGFAAAGAAALVLAPGSHWWWLAAALFIQLRLLANMLDGLVAVEGGRSSPTGALFNEFPDRIEDCLLLVAAGYAAALPALGWSAALLAMGTAYIRALGGSLGQPQDFCGPMAKPQRMATLTLGALLNAVLPAHPVMAFALGAIAVGAGYTCLRRLLRLARHLRKAAP
jgi:phosphatidylglycerophosphate synthase